MSNIVLKPVTASLRSVKPSSRTLFRHRQYRCLHASGFKRQTQFPNGTNQPDQHELPPKATLQPAIHRDPRFERPPPDDYIPPPPDKGSFHPAVAGFFAGSLCAFALSFLVFHFSGAYHVWKANDENRKRLLRVQSHILGVPDPRRVVRGDKTPEQAATLEEALDFLHRSALFHSPFMPNSHIFVAKWWIAVTKISGEGGTDRAALITAIVVEYAEEMKKSINAGAVGWYNGKTGWDITRKYMDRISALGEDEKT